MPLDKFLTNWISTSPIHKCFYHFTDERNIESIKRHGLLSSAACRERGITITSTGGNDWSRDADSRSGMDQYVHLAFTNDHPMAYLAEKSGQIEKVHWLRVDPQVIKIPGARITRGVSNRADSVPLDPTTHIQELDLEVLYKRTNWKDTSVQARLQSAKKYEVLVPVQIPITSLRF